MSRSIKSVNKLKSMLGQEVKVHTLDGVVGICLVTEDNEGDTCLISKDPKLSEARYFWGVEDYARKSIKNCTEDYVSAHYCWRKDQITEELKWVTSKITDNKSVKETNEEIVLEPKSVEELRDNAPCKVRLKDGQVGYVDYEEYTPTVYFNTQVDNIYGWGTDRKGFKYGWHINDEEDFEAVFEKV